MIRVDALEKRHRGAPEMTLRGVTFQVPAGRLVAILGSSGAGKTTLLRCLVGLELDVGVIEIDGVSARAQDGRRACALLRGRVGLVPQSLDLFPHLSALENCALAPRIVKRESPDAAQARASRLLARFGLADKLDAYPEQLSGGQRQRVAIARALAVEPRVLLYDEPTSSLDPSMKDEVRRALMTVSESGVTQLIATHDVEFARTTHWLLVLEDGRIAREGEPAQVLA